MCSFCLLKWQPQGQDAYVLAAWGWDTLNPGRLGTGLWRSWGRLCTLGFGPRTSEAVPVICPSLEGQKPVEKAQSRSSRQDSCAHVCRGQVKKYPAGGFGRGCWIYGSPAVGDVPLKPERRGCDGRHAGRHLGEGPGGQSWIHTCRGDTLEPVGRR